MSQTDRRQFIAGTTAAIAGGALLSAFPGSARADDDKGKAGAPNWKALVPGAVDETGKYALPKLPYGYDAVSEVIDPKTMELHHDKHHAGYVKGLLAAEDAFAKAHASGDYDMVEYWSRQTAFHGGGHVLHCLFWDSIGPENMGGEPKGDLAKQIDKNFGAFKSFWAHFAAAAKKVEGSGWAILGYNFAGEELVILQAQNQQLNTQWAVVPLLVLDVWEHAYYLKYQNDRAAYVDAFPKIINWDRVGKRFGILKG